MNNAPFPPIPRPTGAPLDTDRALIEAAAVEALAAVYERYAAARERIAAAEERIAAARGLKRPPAMAGEARRRAAAGGPIR